MQGIEYSELNNMKIVTFDNIIEINNLIGKYGYKLSLRDTCGAQSMQLKPLSEDCILSDSLYEDIENYFKKFETEIEYSMDKTFIFIKKN